MPTIKIGLLLGSEISMPDTLEAFFRHLNLKIHYQGETFDFVTERITIEPFDIRSRPVYHLVIDRVSHLYRSPREWLKKVVYDGVYLLNSPFTFQSMEKHTGFCAMAKLGLAIPSTWLLTQKEHLDLSMEENDSSFKIDEIAESIGYPLYMKPYDGGGCIGVWKIRNPQELHEACEASGTRIMHLQKAIEYDKFVRALSIGPQVLPLRYDPERPFHLRYVIDHAYLSPEEGKLMIEISKLVGAFFGWEYNSCEAATKDGLVYPVDFSNAVPDSSLVSLHLYFPWVIKALVRWIVFCTVKRRKFPFNRNISAYLAIANEEISFAEKMEKYQKPVRAYFQEDEFWSFCEEFLPHIDEAAIELFTSEEFKRIILKEVTGRFPEYERQQFYAHYEGLLNHWASCEARRLKSQERE